MRDIYRESCDPEYRPWPVRRDANAEHADEKEDRREDERNRR